MKDGQPTPLDTYDWSEISDHCVNCALPLWAAHRPCVPSTDCDPVELRRVELECRG